MNRQKILILMVCAAVLVGLLAVGSAVRAEPAVFINEIHYDNTGTDTGEAVEIAGPAGTDLTGWSLVLYNGNGGVVYNNIGLSGTLPDLGGGYGVLSFATVGLQNGAPDGLALVDASSAVVQFLSYEGSFTAVGGPADGLLSEDIGVSEPGSDPVGYSLQLIGTGATYTDFTWMASAPNTFDSFNTGQSFGGVVSPDPVINEIRIDQPSTDNDEYFELAGQAGTTLDGLTYLVIGDGVGGSGVIENVTALDGYSIGASGFFVAAESTFSLGTADLTTDLNFENSDNVTHLLVRGFSGANGDDLDTNDDGVLDVTPWSEQLDLIALVEEPNPPAGTEFHYGPPQVGPDGSFVPGHVLRCDTDWQIGPFDPASGVDTPGAANECAPPPPPEMCGDPVTLIHDVQGNGLASPLVGTEVAIEGIVVGDFQNNGEPDNGDLSGFHVQEENVDADADPQTSEGIFVYAPGGMDVSVGDHVRVRGSVSEYFTLTELSASQIWLCSSDNPLPDAATVALPVTNVDDFEAFEGMRVTFPQDLVISEYFNFDRFGEIVLTSERHLTPTAFVEPGPDAVAAAQEYVLDRITLDDGRSTQNPDPAIHPNGMEFNLDNLFRGGDTVANVTGIMDYAFSLYRIQPTAGADYTNTNPRPAAPEDVGGDVKVASFNVLNYFTTIDDGVNDICGPEENQECRGADNEDELTRQRAKILSALSTMNADVVGLIEIENNITDGPTADLVSGLNDILGAGTYDYIATGAIGSDAIRVALIYKPGSVTPLGSYAVLDSSVDPRFLDDFNRPALAQSFRSNTNGGVFTVAVNHLKSKGSSCDAIGDFDNGDGAGNCNLTRLAAAQALVDWLAADPTGSFDADTLIIGDLNSYDKEDPIDAILAGSDDLAGTGDDYTDLLYTYIGEDAYSYVFDGQIGYLDHGLANATLRSQVTGATVWHINADEPDLIDYDTSFKQPAQDAIYAPDAYRSSDHDPVIIGLDLEEPTVERLEEIVSYYAEIGEITGRNTALILLKHLDQAIFLRDSGVTAGYRAQLQAFANQVVGFTPKFVTPEASTVLVRESWLLYHLASDTTSPYLIRQALLAGMQ